jgi:polyphosphate kinase
MPRNLDRRVEAVAPIEDRQLQQQLESLLDLYLNDSGAWHMNSDGTYSQRPPNGERQVSQTTLMERWRGGLTTAKG